MKTWVDVSGIYHWKGNFTGIQRVNYNIAKELESSDLNFGFFVYNSHNFHEISFEELESHLKLANDKSPTQKTQRSYSFKKTPYYTIAISKKLIKGTKLEPSIGTIYRLARKKYRQIKGLPTHVTSRSIFSPDDIIVVVDGNWQFAGYDEAIVSLKKSVGFRFIHMVQDLIAYNNPALVNQGANKIIGDYFSKVFKAADDLIAISKSTKQDIEWFLKINSIRNKPKISVIRLGDIFNQQASIVAAQPSKKLPDKFILSVSTIEVRKNYLAFYYVYNLAFQKGIDIPDLVIVGRRGWMAEETYSLLTRDPKINKKVTILNPRDSELEWLYQHCMFTVFPSFYEGWGLPIGESLAHGKCCISSNTSSMAEVGGDLVDYVSPYDTSGLLDKIIYLNNEKIRSRTEEKIATDYKIVSWQETFAELKAIITRVNE